jgi:hypothetical protein
MNLTNRLTSTHTVRQSLTAEILADVEHEIDDVLAWAPDELTEDDQKAIRDQVIAEARVVLDALETRQLEDQGAREWYMCGVAQNVRHLINWRMAQGKKA